MTFTLRRRPFLLAGLAAGLPTLASASDLAATTDRIARALMTAHDIPGLALGISMRGQRHLFHDGLASRSQGTPITPDTLFEIGSLSKPFTATLAAWAQVRGELSLADSPARTLPQLRGTALEAATLLHLGTYTPGGLPLQFPEDITTLEQAFAWYRTWQPQARPGAVRRYSNPSIGLLGHVAAQAMQGDFTALMEQELLTKLGLRQTFLRVPPARQAAYAWGHLKDGREVRVNPGVFDAQAYGVKTTASDLLRFVELNLDASPLEPALRDAVAATHVGHFRVGPMVQGLGWEQYPYPVPLAQLQAGNSSAMALEPQPAQALPAAAPAAATLFNKTGATNGFGAYAAFVPAQRIGVVLLANRNIPNAARIDAVHALLGALA